MRFRDRVNTLATGAIVASAMVVLGASAAGPTLAANYGSGSQAAASAPASLQLGAGTSAGLGSFLVGPNGMTLYTLSSETSTGSVCTGGCLANWPPLLVAAGGSISGPAGATGRFSTITRADDGSTQVAYNGQPLYYFAHDSAAGQTNGEGIKAFGGVWHVALAVAAAASGSPSATASPTAAASVPPTSTDGGQTGDGPATLPSILLVLLGASAATLIAVGAMARRARRA